MKSSISIYIACLASYNSSILHGKWYELNDYDNEENLLKDIGKMLKESPIPNAEEWEIHDYDSTINSSLLDGYDLEHLIALNEVMNTLNEDDIVEEFLKEGITIEEMERKRENLVFYADFEEYAEHYIDDCCYNTKENEFLIRYLDWEKLARDLRIESVYYETKSGIYIDYN